MTNPYAKKPVTANDSASKGDKPSLMELEKDVELTICGLHVADPKVSVKYSVSLIRKFGILSLSCMFMYWY